MWRLPRRCWLRAFCLPRPCLPRPCEVVRGTPRETSRFPCRGPLSRAVPPKHPGLFVLQSAVAPFRPRPHLFCRPLLAISSQMVRLRWKAAANLPAWLPRGRHIRRFLRKAAHLTSTSTAMDRASDVATIARQQGSHSKGGDISYCSVHPTSLADPSTKPFPVVKGATPWCLAVCKLAK